MLRSLTVLWLSVAACTPPAATPGEPSSTTIVQDGLALTLTLESRTTAPGEALGMVFDVRNVGAGAIMWRGIGCAMSAPITVLPLAPPADPMHGQRDEDLADALAELTAGVDDPAQVEVLPDGISSGSRSCALDHGYSELRGGASLRFRGVWPASTVLGAPLVPGTYLVRAEFARLRADAALVPADYRADRDAILIAMETQVTVTSAGGPSGLSARTAAERMISNPDVAATLVEAAGPIAPRLSFASGVWELRIRLGGRRSLVAHLPNHPGAAPVVRFEVSASP